MRALIPVVLAAAATAAASGAVAAERLVPADKVFPELGRFLALPAAARDTFATTYQVRTRGGPLEAVKLSYVEGGVRAPIPLGRDGRVLRLPTPAQLKGQVAVDTPEGVRLSTRAGVECTGLAGREIAAPRVSACVDQLRAAVKRMAGVAAFLAPSFDRARLEGAGGGAVVLADGSRRPLPLQDGAPVFTPSAFPGARTLVLDRAAQHVSPDTAPKP